MIGRIRKNWSVQYIFYCILGSATRCPDSDMPAVVKRVMTGDQEGQKVKCDRVYKEKLERAIYILLHPWFYYPVPEPLSDMLAVAKRVMTGDQEGQKVGYCHRII